MKRLFRLLALVLAIVLCLTACGGTGTETSAPSTTAKTTTTTAASESEATTDTTAEETTTEGTAAEDTTTTQPSKTTQESTTSRTTASTEKVTSTTKATTTSRTKNVQMGQTQATEAPTTTVDKSGGKAIKILGVGNSFTVDSMRHFLFGIFASAGYTDITLGYLNIGGCSIDTHYDNLTNRLAAYEYWKNTDDDWVLYANATAVKAFGEAKWDVVTIQQVSSDSGRPATYKNLAAVVDILRQTEPQAKILWHMTWAYQQNSDHWAFAYYNKDQMTMYNAITATVQEQVLPLTAIRGVIPSGTAIQNLRTSSLGDTLTADGHHLNDTYGDYTAALTWYCTITGESAETVTYRPASIEDKWEEIAAAVNNAVKTPFAVTPF